MLGIRDMDGMKVEEWGDGMDEVVGSEDDVHVRVRDLGHGNGCCPALVHCGCRGYCGCHPALVHSGYFRRV